MDKNFIKDIDTFANNYKKNGDWYQFWNLCNKYPQYLNEDDSQHLHDKILVPLANKNVIKKRIGFTEKIIMLLRLYRDIQNFTSIYLDFWNFIENGHILVYRGTHKKIRDLHKNEYLNFSLSKETAIRFIQYGWVAGIWYDENKQNGFLCKTKISIKNNFHIYNNEGDEYEIVVKGPLHINKIQNIKNGKVV